MEWGNFRKLTNMSEDIEPMIDFLYSYQLKPYMLHNYGEGMLLNRNVWHIWPIQVIWKKV